MKVCIAGSRDIDSVEFVMDIIDLGLSKLEITPTEIVSGTAKGVDKLGEIWAARHEIPIKQMPADWGRHGKAAGPIRNKAMADYCNASIVIWDTVSKGSKHMIDTMRKHGDKSLFVYYLPSMEIALSAHKPWPRYYFYLAGAELPWSKE